MAKKNLNQKALDAFYLHYYYDNFNHNDVGSGLVRLTGESRQAVFQRQLEEFAARSNSLRAKALKNATEAEKRMVEDLYDAENYKDIFDKVFQERRNFDQASGFSSTNFQDLLQKSKTIENTDLSSVQTYLDALKKTFIPMIVPGNKTKSQQVYNDYCEQLLLEAGYGKNDHFKSEFAEKALRQILSSKDESFINLKSQSVGTDVKDWAKRVIATIKYMEDLASQTNNASAHIFSDEALKIERDKNPNYTSGEAILNRLVSSLQKSIRNAAKNGAEKAAALAAGRAAKELREEAQKVDKALQMAVSGRTVGTKSVNSATNKNRLVDYSVSYTDRTLVEALTSDMLTRTGKGGKIESVTPKTLNDKHSKSDVALSVSNDRVALTVGLTVKDAETMRFEDGKIIGHGMIKLQSDTPFYTLLVRELGITDSEMREVLHLASGHAGNLSWHVGNSAQLDAKWERFVSSVEHQALLTTLTGAEMENVQFLVLNGKVLPIAEILSELANRTDYSKSVVLESGKYDVRDRSTYVDTNKWIKGDRKVASIERSNTVMPNLIRKLYDTKITVRLDPHAIEHTILQHI